MTDKRNIVLSDLEILVESLQEVQRLLIADADPATRKNRGELLEMIEYLVCDPEVTRALMRQRRRARLKLVG